MESRAITGNSVAFICAQLLRNYPQVKSTCAQVKSLALETLPTIHSSLSTQHIYISTGVPRAGHVPTFLKSFRSILERGPSDKSFRSRSFFVVSFRSVPFRSVLSRKTVFPFRSWRSYLKNGSIPLVLFLVKERL